MYPNVRHPFTEIRKWRRWAAVLLALAVGLAVAGHVGGADAATDEVAAAEPPLYIYYHDRPPYYQMGVNGQLGGLVGRYAESALRQSGLDFQWFLLPANRHLKQIYDDRKPACALGWFKSAEREAFAKFSVAIYQDAPVVALYRKDNAQVKRHETIKSLFKDSDLALGWKLGYSYGAEVDSLVETLGPRVVTTSRDPGTMVRMVIAGRFDYFFAAPEELDALLRNLGDEASKVAYLLPKDAKAGNKRYFLCSRSVPDEIIHALNGAIKAAAEVR